MTWEMHVTDSIFTSLLRGRMLATVTASAAAGISTTAAITETVNELTTLATAVLALVSALAAVASKLRELRRSMSVESVIRAVIEEHTRSKE